MEKQSSEKRFALLIDADNVSAKYIKPITDELSKYGTVTYKRIYGDWTLTLHAKWKDALLENSITPIQQFGYTQGKNATDSAMIIDAMDILYTRSVEGFCIVSSDSDFTRLASRIRESGLTVIGMGEKKTPVPFRKACDIFTTLELLLPGNGKNGRGKGKPDQGGQAANSQSNTGPSIEEIEQAVVNIITDNQNNGKSTGLGEVGSRLLKRYPDFDVRSYGTNQLKKLLDEFESVVVTKDGSSVTVELAEEKSTEREPEAAAGEAVAAAGENPASERENAAASEAANEQPRESTGTVGEKRLRRSTHMSAKRGTTSTLKPADKTDKQEAETPAAPETPKTAKETSATKAAPQAEKPAEEVPSPAAETGVASDASEPVDFRPGRATRKRAAASRGGTTKHEAREAKPRKTSDEAQRDTASDTPTPKAAPKRRTTKANAGKAKPQAAPTAPAAVAPATSTATGAEAFIRQTVADAGAEGAELGALGKRVRAKFRTFKVRDLGYPQLRSYVADLDGITVEQRDGRFYARLA
ncbi:MULTISPECIES: NYN domain-containing protein [Gordonibacter]|uniref:NYN domain-containing protein n=1 Tax=Gordonibacter faecis TaxID=3047475 RepID=A0ABT7DJ29_9ACTN|nr:MULTISPECIES: NYN domain-containing protein [unclassified Gordonibacter]MDJ1649528.1 NYN domain-containing protein [Gordonibacter sp. KGMB12511]HIW76661.1 NYN domain-containing protein [Candidatus Gordonibacter avicola]